MWGSGTGELSLQGSVGVRWLNWFLWWPGSTLVLHLVSFAMVCLILAYTSGNLGGGNSRSIQLSLSGLCQWLISQPSVEGVPLDFTSSTSHAYQYTTSTRTYSFVVRGSSLTQSPTVAILAPSRASPASLSLLHHLLGNCMPGRPTVDLLK